ncbi:MAG: polysaccharide biosynthesis/export family protein [Bryobacteraceae bacterium]|nr:polysaccharide biosynthesis/export family protein [Bryobacteraceae bacterium]
MNRPVSVLVALALGAFAVFAQSKPINGLGPMADAGTMNLPGQKIGPNDLVGISVYDAPELTRTIRVSSDGFVALPMLKKKIRAAGLLPGELEQEISGALKDGGILVDPIVAVTIVEYHSRPISVMGAVKKPLTFQAVGRITLLEALGRAEGLNEFAGPEILLTQPDPDQPGKTLLTRFSVRDVLDKSNEETRIELRGGEEIRVPEAKKIYVAGNVKKPGAFPVRDGSPMTVLKALTLTEGVTPFYMKTVYILRPQDDGSKKEIPVELSKILKRESPDVELEPEDLLYIPENTSRKTAVTLAEKASSFGLATISGLLIWRR